MPQFERAWNTPYPTTPAFAPPPTYPQNSRVRIDVTADESGVNCDDPSTIWRGDLRINFKGRPQVYVEMAEWSNYWNLPIGFHPKWKRFSPEPYPPRSARPGSGDIARASSSSTSLPSLHRTSGVQPSQRVIYRIAHDYQRSPGTAIAAHGSGGRLSTQFPPSHSITTSDSAVRSSPTAASSNLSLKRKRSDEADGSESTKRTLTSIASSHVAEKRASSRHDGPDKTLVGCPPSTRNLKRKRSHDDGASLSAKRAALNPQSRPIPWNPSSPDDATGSSSAYPLLSDFAPFQQPLGTGHSIGNSHPSSSDGMPQGPRQNGILFDSGPFIARNNSSGTSSSSATPRFTDAIPPAAIAWMREYCTRAGVLALADTDSVVSIRCTSLGNRRRHWI